MQNISSWEYNWKFFLRGLINSYSQVFFSNNLFFGFVLLIVSFVDVYAGLAGVLSVLVTNSTGILLGLSRKTIYKGVYGFNSLLVGLSLGIYYQPGFVLYFLILLAAVLTLFISVSLQGVIGKYGLPFLSIPFLLGAWSLSLASRNLSFLGISERGIFTINDLYVIGGNGFVQIYEWWNNVAIPSSIKVYFISLGAILFQFNVLSGIVIAAGLLYYSRISFTLSVAGFFTAFFFYKIVGADLTDINYSYIGFNYILTSIAVGGFFIIPSARSYFWSVLLIPIVAILTLGISVALHSLSLPVYSLPFNMVVLLFLYVLKFRVNPSYKLSEVLIQQNSPEKNLYSFQNDIERFRHDMIPVQLPFFGKWTVSQGYEGDYTHKEAWKHALDFIITDTNGKQHKGKGDTTEDYFCFEKPVLAPADGYVESVTDGIEDNIIGKVNIKENWGNSIVIRHNNFTFSSLSHLKKGSISVKSGDKIRQGDIIGKCGNSGRSPFPHLHFQIQALPYIGSPTLNYPLSNYIAHSKTGFELKNYAVPSIDQTISNIEKNQIISNGFDFIPGKILCFDTQKNGKSYKDKWEASTDEYNNTFIKCSSSGAIAYYSNDGGLFIFRHYEGPKDTLLYYFFLAAFKVQLGFYKDLVVTDYYPLNLIFKNPLLFLQDFLAPFYKFIRSEYKMKYEYIDNEVFASEVKLVSSATNFILGKQLKYTKFAIKLDENGLNTLEIQVNGDHISARLCLDQ